MSNVAARFLDAPLQSYGREEAEKAWKIGFARSSRTHLCERETQAGSEDGDAAFHAYGRAFEELSPRSEEEERYGPNHVVENHVGKPWAQLERSLRQSDKWIASTFATLERAQFFVEAVLNHNEKFLNEIVSNIGIKAVLDKMFHDETGYAVVREHNHSLKRQFVEGVRVLVAQHSYSERGYRVLTAFPIPADQVARGAPKIWRDPYQKLPGAW